MPDFVINLERTYPETCPCSVKDADGNKQVFDIPVVFKVKPLTSVTNDLEVFAEEHAEKVAASAYPLLWVVIDSVDLSDLNIKANGKALPKQLWLDAVVLDPMLSAAVYRQYNKTISGNAPAAT